MKVENSIKDKALPLTQSIIIVNGLNLEIINITQLPKVMDGETTIVVIIIVFIITTY